MNIVLFGAPWCDPCKALKPLLTSAAHGAGLLVEYVDVEFPDDRANDITAVPTVRVYDLDENVGMEHRGGMSSVQVRSFVERAAGW